MPKWTIFLGSGNAELLRLKSYSLAHFRWSGCSFDSSNGFGQLFLLVLLAAHIDIIPTAVATMTKASGIVKFVMVRALGGEFLPTLRRITLLAHPFGVVLMVHMRTLSHVPPSSLGPNFLFLDEGSFLLSQLMASLLVLNDIF